jgi:FKBP-type peptidyl-prolyl cis-trans isomerase (trigger factor)
MNQSEGGGHKKERNSVAHVEAQVATRSDKKQPPATPPTLLQIEAQTLAKRLSRNI